MNNENIVTSIRTLCKKNNISITKLEEDIGLSQGLISRWGKTTPSLDKIIDIADYFQVSLDEVVGYKNKVDDQFLNLLIERTGDDSIFWKLYHEEEIAHVAKKSYYSKFNDGYIYIYGEYKDGKVINPFKIQLFIRPTENSAPVEQKYSTKQLLSLWIKILKSLEEEAPDEIRAEEFKNSFVNDSYEKFDVYTNKQLKQITSNLIEFEPNFVTVFEKINTPEFLEVEKMFTSENFKKSVALAKRLGKYYEMIKAAQRDRC